MNINLWRSTMKCPLCNHALVKRNGKYGEFYGCSDYPHCMFTKSINGSVVRETKQDRERSKDYYIKERYGNIDYSEDLEFWIKASPNRAMSYLIDTGKRDEVPKELWHRLCKNIE